MDIDAVRASLLALARPAGRGPVTVRAILAATAAHFGTTVAVLVSESRKQPLVRRRQIAMWVAMRLTGRGLPFIAHVMRKRDHTTILHGVRAIETRIEAGDAEIIAAAGRIIEELQGVPQACGVPHEPRDRV